MPSAKQDMTKLCNDIDALIGEFMRVEGRTGVIVAFTIPPNYNEQFWVSNLSRPDMIRTMQDLLGRMIAEGN